jgi:hypothetical protein
MYHTFNFAQPFAEQQWRTFPANAERNRLVHASRPGGLTAWTVLSSAATRWAPISPPGGPQLLQSKPPCLEGSPSEGHQPPKPASKTQVRQACRSLTPQWLASPAFSVPPGDGTGTSEPAPATTSSAPGSLPNDKTKEIFELKKTNRYIRTVT